MRTDLTIAALASLLVACSTTETVAPPPRPPVDWRSLDVRVVPDAGSNGATAKERAVTDAYADALRSPGFARLASRLDDDARLSFPGREDARGRDAVVRAHDALLGAFDERTVATTRIWATESTQVVEWSIAGIQARDFLGVAPTRRPVGFRGITLLGTKDDGSITDVRVYFDVAAVKGQLGVGPKELVGLPLAAPATTAPMVVEQTGSPDERTNVDLARAVLDALENDDLVAYENAVANDVEVFTLERAQPARGKEEARAYFKAMHKAIGQLDTTTINGWGFPGFAIVEYEIAGDQLGPLGWVPAQRDRVVRLHVVDVVEVRDAKIARVWRFENPAEILTSPG
jgi:ketosteroid isomerase-like protein